jgi:type I restriction enzyme R subunit
MMLSTTSRQKQIPSSKAVPSGGELQEDPAEYKTEKGVGYVRGKAADYNAEFAIDEAKFWQFLETTQGEEIAKLHYKPDYKRQVLERLHRKLKKDGILAVLKKGLAVDNAKFELIYRMPHSKGSNEADVLMEYRSASSRKIRII